MVVWQEDPRIAPTDVIRHKSVPRRSDPTTRDMNV